MRLARSAMTSCIATALVVAACDSAMRPPAGLGGDTEAPTSSSPPITDANTDVDTDADASSDASADSATPDAAPCFGDEDSGVVDCAASDASAACGLVCERLLARYRNGVGARAARCVLALPSCADGGEDDVPSCVDPILARACATATASTYCAPIVASCDDAGGDAGSVVTSKGCEAFANGLSDAGREELRACILGDPNASCTLGSVACFDSIRR